MKKQININIIIPKELHRKLKLESIKQDVTLKDLIISKFKQRANEK